MGDAQSAKRAAAVAYDYEGDPRWTEYWSNVLIPPHMAFRSDVIDHFKLKFYHRFVMCRLFHMFQKCCILPHKKSMWSSCYHFCHRHVAMIFDDTIQDPEFVVANMSSARSSQSTRASTTCSSTPMREHTRPQNSGAISGGSAASNRSLSSLQLDKRTIHFSVNAWVLIVAFLGVLPIVPRNLSSKAFRLSLLGTALSSFYSLYSLYGILKLMYNAPATAGYHQSVWAKIGQAANPYIYRYAPFLNTPISTIQRWWFL